MQSLDGKAVAQLKQQQLVKPIQAFIKRYARPPQLSVLMVGDDPSSRIYVQRKTHVCASLGIASKTIHLNNDISMSQLFDTITQLNDDNQVDGILLQLPLPQQLDVKEAIDAIRSDKDVDGFTSTNIGRLALRNPILRPCTPWGIMQLLDHYQIELTGKHALVLGASLIVGRPLCLEFLMANATVSCCHKHSTQVKALIPQADIIVSAIGKRNVYSIEKAKSNAVIIDVGIHRLDTGEIVGDVCRQQLANHPGYATPVPGGVGPMTIACLMQNTVSAAHQRMAAQIV